jgi:hypothetical protein
MGVQLLVGVDFVAVFLGKLVRDPQRLTERHQQGADGRQNHRQIGGERHARNGKRRQPLRQRAHHFDAETVSKLSGAEPDAPEQDHQTGGDLLVPARQQEQQRQERRPTAKVTQLACGSP